MGHNLESHSKIEWILQQCRIPQSN